jgi:SH3-like domain-containing protein
MRLVLPLLLALLCAPALGDQVVLKNGSIIEGEVTVDEGRNTVIVKRGGATLSFSRDDVLEIIKDRKKPEADEPKDAGPLQAIVIPIHGSLQHQRARDELDTILEEAIGHRPKLIVFEINSSGGAISVGNHFSRRITALKGFRTAAFIHGNGKGAFSAAAYVALSCDRIYMSPGQSIGAAVAWRKTADGTPANVAAKFSSAWQASFRATAEANGHSGAIVQAMVDATDGVAEIVKDGKRSFIPASELFRRNKKGIMERRDPEGAQVRILCKPGQVLTLTTKEARRVGLCKGVAADTMDFLTKLKVNTKRVTRLDDPLALARAFVKKEQAKLDKDVATFNKRYNQLVEEAPGNHGYERGKDGLFKDGGREWRRRTRASLRVIKKALAQIDEIQERAKRHPDLRVDRKAVDGYAKKLTAFESELKKLRHITRPPPRRRR